MTYDVESTVGSPPCNASPEPSTSCEANIHMGFGQGDFPLEPEGCLLT